MRSAVVLGPGGGIPIVVPEGGTQKTWNVGGSWNFGFMKIMGLYDQEKFRGFKEDMWSVSAVIPFGQAEIHVGYDRNKPSWTARSSPATPDNATVEQIKATLQYNISKRTAMYLTGSFLKNKDDTRVTLPTQRRPDRTRRRLAGLRNRPASLLLIARSPRASCHRELKGRLRAAFFMPARRA